MDESRSDEKLENPEVQDLSSDGFEVEEGIEKKLEVVDDSPVISPPLSEEKTPIESSETIEELKRRAQLGANMQDQFTTKKLITVLVSVFSLLSIIFGGIWLYYNVGFNGELYESSSGYSLELPSDFERIELGADTLQPVLAYVEGFTDSSGDYIRIFNKYSENFEEDVENFLGDYATVETERLVLSGMSAVVVHVGNNSEQQSYVLFESAFNTTYIIQAISVNANIVELVESIKTFSPASERIATNKCYSFNLAMKYAAELTDRVAVSGTEPLTRSENCELSYVVVATKDADSSKVIYSEQGEVYVMSLQSRVDYINDVYGDGATPRTIADTFVSIASSAGSDVSLNEVTLDSRTAYLIQTTSSSINSITRYPTESYLLLAEMPDDYLTDSRAAIIQLSLSDALAQDASEVVEEIIKTWRWQET